MARRKDHSRDEIREMAIQAASRILEDDGPEALTARRVAKAIGYAPGTLYNVFADLDELAIFVNGWALDDLRQALMLARQQAAENDRATTVDVVMALARTQLDFMRQRPNVWWQLFHVRWPDDQLLPEWYIQKIAQTMGELEQALLPEFDNDDSDGDDDGDGGFRDRLVRTLWAGFFGICEVAALRQLMIVPTDDIEDMTKFMVEACIAKAKAQKRPDGVPI